MKLQFVGAAQTVTGSMHLLHINGSKILFDCGMFQGKRKEAFEINRTFDQFNPKDIDIVILSHAHIDHAGNLPTLVKNGFKGPIYSTRATKDLAYIMLQDCAHIQEKDVEFVNKRRKKQGKHLFEPLYTSDDVEKTISLFKAFNYHEDIDITPDVRLRFYDAGHILGSSLVHLMIQEKERVISFAFSGDLGRPNLPILRDPDKIPDVDYFICESTYGGRFHDAFDVSGAKIIEVLKRAVEKKSKIIVPSFSVGRTQEIVYILHTLFNANPELRIPIYVDSPLSVNATEVFRKHPECFDFETSRFIMKHEDPFGFNLLNYITSVDSSKALNDTKGPMMIISSSGMAEAGRIQHHLANNIQDANNMVLMVGYCAEHTLGRKIIEGEKELHILGDTYQMNAEVVLFNSLSAHADSNELIDYCKKLDTAKMKKIFLVHGDLDQQEKFRTRLNEIGFPNIEIPKKGDVFEI